MGGAAVMLEPFRAAKLINLREFSPTLTIPDIHLHKPSSFKIIKIASKLPELNSENIVYPNISKHSEVCQIGNKWHFL